MDLWGWKAKVMGRVWREEGGGRTTAKNADVGSSESVSWQVTSRIPELCWCVKFSTSSTSPFRLKYNSHFWAWHSIQYQNVNMYICDRHLTRMPQSLLVFNLQEALALPLKIEWSVSQSCHNWWRERGQISGLHLRMNFGTSRFKEQRFTHVRITKQGPVGDSSFEYPLVDFVLQFSYPSRHLS